MEALSKKIRGIIISYVFYIFCAWFFIMVLSAASPSILLLYTPVLLVGLLIAIGNIACELFKALQEDKAEHCVQDKDEVPAEPISNTDSK